MPDGTRGIGQIRSTITTDSNNNVFEYNSAGTAETNNIGVAAVTFRDRCLRRPSACQPVGRCAGRSAIGQQYRAALG
ncbi:MAG: hypothetical protein WDN50_14000 [Bradyrhizobium sp.]